MKTLLVFLTFILIHFNIHSQTDLPGHFQGIRLLPLSGDIRVKVTAMSKEMPSYIVGLSYDDQGHRRGVQWVYHGTETSAIVPYELRIPESSTSHVEIESVAGVNNHGDAAGTAIIYGPGQMQRYAYYWQLNRLGARVFGLTPSPLETSGNTTADAIDDKGNIFGTIIDRHDVPRNRSYIYMSAENAMHYFFTNDAYFTEKVERNLTDNNRLQVVGQMQKARTDIAKGFFVYNESREKIYKLLPIKTFEGSEAISLALKYKSNKSFLIIGNSTKDNVVINPKSKKISMPTLWIFPQNIPEQNSTNVDPISLGELPNADQTFATDINQFEMITGYARLNNRSVAILRSVTEGWIDIESRLSIPIENMPNGAAVKLTNAVAINNNNNIVCNAASVLNDVVTENAAAYLLMKAPPMVIQLFKSTTNSEVNQGDCITYSFNIINLNNGRVMVSLVDPLPEGTIFETCPNITQDTVWHFDGTNITANNLIINAFQSRTIHLTVKVKPNRRSDVINTHYKSRVAGEDEILWNDAVRTSIRIPETDVSLVKIGDSFINPGQCLTYTFTVSNTNRSPASFTITDSIPRGTSFDPSCANIGWNNLNGKLIYNGLIPDDTTVTITLKLLVTASGGDITNKSYTSKTNSRPEIQFDHPVVTHIGHPDPSITLGGGPVDGNGTDHCKAINTCDTILLSVSLPPIEGMLVVKVVFIANFSEIGRINVPSPTGVYEIKWYHPYPGDYHVEAEAYYQFPGENIKKIISPTRNIKVDNNPHVPHLPIYRLILPTDLSFTPDYRGMGPEFNYSAVLNDNHKMLFTGRLNNNRASVIWEIGANFNAIDFTNHDSDIFSASVFNNSDQSAGTYQHGSFPGVKMDCFKKDFSSPLQKLNNLLPCYCAPGAGAGFSSWVTENNYETKDMNADGEILYGFSKTNILSHDPNNYDYTFEHSGKIWTIPSSMLEISEPHVANTFNLTYPICMNSMGKTAGVYFNSNQIFGKNNMQATAQLFLYNRSDVSYTNLPLSIPSVYALSAEAKFNFYDRTQSLLNVFVNNKNHMVGSFTREYSNPHATHDFFFCTSLDINPNANWQTVLTTDSTFNNFISSNNFKFGAIEGLNDFDFVIGTYSKGSGFYHFLSIPACNGIRFINNDDILNIPTALTTIFSNYAYHLTGINNYGEICGFYYLNDTLRPFALVPIGPNPQFDACQHH